MARYVELRRHTDADGDVLTPEGVRAAPEPAFETARGAGAVASQSSPDSASGSAPVWISVWTPLGVHLFDLPANRPDSVRALSLCTHGPRSFQNRRPTVRHGLPLLGLVLVVAVGGLAAWLLADRRSSSRSPVTQAQRAPARTRPQLSRRVRRRLPLKLVERRTGLLPAPVQD